MSLIYPPPKVGFMAANIEIYTWSRCPFCIRAKALLDQKKVRYTEYCIDGDEVARSAMAKRANGRRSVPQIFINDYPIGGCDDLYALNAQGTLDPLLQDNSKL
jgi:glutaredoxin 3